MTVGISTTQATPTTRERMVAGAVDLLSRRGVRATSLRDVVQHTGTPRGSLVHHFPGGKQQMLEEALRFATDSVAAPLQVFIDEHGAVGGLRAFGAWWKRILESSGFEAGCPVLAVAIEPGHPTDDASEHAALHTLATMAFDRWQAILATALRDAGVKGPRARRLAMLALASIEGTVAICRAAQSSTSLDDVLDELVMAFDSAIAST